MESEQIRNGKSMALLTMVNHSLLHHTNSELPRGLS